jgi:hypothetical protein
MNLKLAILRAKSDLAFYGPRRSPGARTMASTSGMMMQRRPATLAARFP